MQYKKKREKMKNILVIIGALRTGGAEKITVDLIENMNRTGMDFYFLVFGNEIGNYEDRVQKMEGKVIHIPRPLFPYLKYKLDLKNIWDQYGPFDIVHTHTLLNNGINCRIFCDFGCKRLISHSHSTNSNRKNSFIALIYERLMKHMIRRYATDYLACGEEAGEYLYGKEFFRREGKVIHNGVEFSTVSFQPETRKLLRDQMGLRNTCVIGHVARLEKLKNHEFVLEILKELNNFSDRFLYMIVGEGSYREAIKNKVKELGLEGQVLMLGNRDDVHQIQNVFDLVIYPSLYEGIPVALIEAQINGVPCIVSENISKEVKIREKTKFVSLEKTAKEWAEEVLSYQNVSREDNVMLETGKLYDIKVSAENLRQVYLSR